MVLIAKGPPLHCILGKWTKLAHNDLRKVYDGSRTIFINGDRRTRINNV